jgi:hypothetical protein
VVPLSACSRGYITGNQVRLSMYEFPSEVNSC